jgi:hypothetical protein
MLAAHWAVNYRGAGSDGDGSGSPDSDRAVDHGQCRLEKRDVPGRLANKVLNLEGVADVHYINVIERPHRRDIHTDDVVTFGNQLEQGLANFAQSDDDYLSVCTQDVTLRKRK